MTNPSGRERSVLNSQCRSFEGVQAALFSVSLSHRHLELQIRFCALHFKVGCMTQKLKLRNVQTSNFHQ